jgi:hypothetical protein
MSWLRSSSRKGQLVHGTAEYVQERGQRQEPSPAPGSGRRASSQARSATGSLAHAPMGERTRRGAVLPSWRGHEAATSDRWDPARGARRDGHRAQHGAEIPRANTGPKLSSRSRRSNLSPCPKAVALRRCCAVQWRVGMRVAATWTTRRVFTSTMKNAKTGRNQMSHLRAFGAVHKPWGRTTPFLLIDGELNFQRGGGTKDAAPTKHRGTRWP